MHYIIGVVSLLVFQGQVFANEFQPYFTIRNFFHSEPTAIKSLGQGWDQPLYSGDVALSYNRMEIGVAMNQWQIGLIKRHDYYYEFNSDTARLLHHIENRILLTPGEQYDLKLSVNSLIAEGLRLAYQYTVNDFKLSLAFSYLDSRDFTDGTLAGTADVLTDKDYDLQFDVDYLYTEDKLFERIASRPHGRGYGIDFMLDWKPNGHWYFKLDVVDLWTQMHWRNALRTVATADSNIKEFDDDGYVVFNPVATGVESTQSYTQNVPRKIFIDTVYSFDNEQALLFGYEDYKLKRFVSAGYSVITEGRSKFDFFYNLTAEAYKFRYQYNRLKLELLTDELQLKKSRTFALQIMINY